MGLHEPKKLMLAGRDLISVRQTGDLGPLAADEVTEPAGFYVTDVVAGRGLSVR